MVLRDVLCCPAAGHFAAQWSLKITKIMVIFSFVDLSCLFCWSASLAYAVPHVVVLPAVQNGTSEASGSVSNGQDTSK